MAYASQIHERTTIIATEAITVQRIVALDGSHTVLKGVGVAEFSAASGATITVITSGICLVESGGSFSAGDILTADADGKAVVVAPAGSSAGVQIQAVGRALEASTGTGQLIRVMIDRHVVIGTGA